MRNAVIALGILFACGPGALALDPSLDVSQYAHTTWRVRDGFVKGAINSIAQTPDGYLWLGTEYGLYRFDGVHAVRWEPPSGQALSSNVGGLLVARDGTLWIGTSNGLASWKNGRLATHPEMAGKDVFRIIEGRDGTIWAGGIANPPPGKLCAFRAGRSECYGDDGSLGTGVSALYEDRKGNLWVGGTWMNGFWRWNPGHPQFFSIPGPPSDIKDFTEDDYGALLIASHGMKRMQGGKVEPYSIPGVPPETNFESFLHDRDGGLWVGTIGHGLVHIRQGKADSFTQVDGLSNDFVLDLLEDREGSIWAATWGGLERFRAYSFPTVSFAQGLPTGEVWSVLAARDGTVWIGTWGGLSRWQQGNLSVFGSPQGDRKPDGKFNGLPADSLFQDRSGRIWISTVRDFGYLEGARFVPIRGFPGGHVHAIAETAEGDLWVASQQSGLIRVSRGQVVQQIPWAGLGAQGFATALAIDPAGKGLWLGFWLGGVAHFADGAIHASYSLAQSAGAVNELRFDEDGALWVATDGGLSRIKGDKLATLNSKNGLACDAVHWSMEDHDQGLWLKQPCGLTRVARADLNAWAAAPGSTVRATVYDATDGVQGHASVSGYRPVVTKTKDGRIWFATGYGVTVIDPRNFQVNKVPPPVHIEQITADDKTYEARSAFRLPPAVRNLTIDFIALSLVAPEKNRYRYKLEGWDRDWRVAVNEFRIEYSNLPPRHYRFRVIACNNSGVWNEAGDSLDFDIPPAWFQTLWFRAFCAIASLLLLWALYQLRIHEIHEQEKKFREAVETMPALAFVNDPDGNRAFVNRAYLEYTRLSPEQASGPGWEKAIHPDDIRRVMERWHIAHATGELIPYDVRVRRGSDGVYRWFQTRARPLYDKRGKIVKWCAVATDIEDRKRAEELQTELAHVSRVSTLGELAASISHELNQPIAAAIMNADLVLHCLHRNPPDLTQVQERATRIIEMNTLASEIIDRLRSLYKKEPPKRESLEVNEVIGEMVELLRGQATRHGVSLRMDLAGELPNVIADRVQLQQVLMNLVLNGIEAMSETGGVLTVKSELRDDGQIEITVNDTGPGLPSGKADQIFNAFFTTKPKGSGMGLAISKSIVESHSGRIWATGNGGHGTTLHFTLPAVPVKADIPVIAK